MLDARGTLYRETPAGDLVITTAPSKSSLNAYARDVDARFGARVVISPASLVCGAGADTDPGDACALTVNLGPGALDGNGAGSTLVHEAKHLAQVAPGTNGGFDSIFFGRISNLDGTDHSDYPSFALDEIAAYASEFAWLSEHKAELAPGWFEAYQASAIKQLGNLLPRTARTVARAQRVLDRLRAGDRSSRVLLGDGSNFAIGDLEKGESAPMVLFNRGDWRGAGQTTIAVFVDGKDQLTMPLFESRLDVGKTAKLIGPKKSTPWPVAPLAKEAEAFNQRLTTLREVVDEAQRALTTRDWVKLAAVMNRGERLEDLHANTLACRATPAGKPTAANAAH